MQSTCTCKLIEGHHTRADLQNREWLCRNPNVTQKPLSSLFLFSSKFNFLFILSWEPNKSFSSNANLFSAHFHSLFHFLTTKTKHMRWDEETKSFFHSIKDKHYYVISQFCVFMCHDMFPIYALMKSVWIYNSYQVRLKMLIV